MPCCCDSRGCDRFFGSRFARRVAARYRRRGLDATTRRIVDFLSDRGIADATVLEVGGGVGEIEIELLIAVDPGAVAPADVVVLHRVVCCYPDYERLLAAAGGRARRLLVFSHPPRNAVSRAVVALQNLGFRLVGREFRTFAHPPEAMLHVLERQGLRPVFSHRGRVWSVAGLERRAVDPLGSRP